jgi:hypothetical protein
LFSLERKENWTCKNNKSRGKRKHKKKQQTTPTHSVLCGA